MSLELYSDIMPALIIKFLRNELSPAERKQLDAWVNSSAHTLLAFQELTHAQSLQLGLQGLNSFDTKKGLQKLLSKLGNKQ